MPVVVMPDGMHVMMPDTPPADLPEPSMWDKAKPYAISAARGIPMSVGGLLSMVKDPMGEAPTVLSKAGDALQSFTNKVLPESKAGNPYGKAAIESGVGGLVSPGGPIRNMLTGGLAGIGGEAGAEATNGSPLGRIFGSLAGGAAAGVAGSRFKTGSAQKTALSKAVVDTLPPGALEKAQAFQAEAAKTGVNLDLVQALEGVGTPSTALETVRNVLANNQAGKRVQETLKNQPAELEVAGDVAIGGVPGRVLDAGTAANNVQETATRVIQQAKNSRTQVWEGTLRDSKKVLQDAADLTVGQAKVKLQGVNMTVGQARDRLEALQANLKQATGRDAAAIEAQNAKVEEAKRLIEAMQAARLPRGSATSNAGRLLELPKRGESIDMDLIHRGAQAERMARDLQPAVEPAPSIETLAAQSAAKQGEEALTKAQQAAVPVREEYNKALASRAAVDTVPAQAALKNIQELKAEAAKYPNTAKGAELDRLASRLMNGEKPLTDPEQINQVLKEAATRLKSPDLQTSGVDAGTAKWIGSHIDGVRQKFETTFAPLREANQRYRQVTEDVINPLKQGPVGQVATRRGYQPDIQATISKVESVFKNGVDPQASTSPIRTLGRELAKADPSAFADAAKTYYSGKLSSAFEPTLNGGQVGNPDAAVKILTNLFGDRKQWQGMKDAATIIAETHGLDPHEVVRGLENYAAITKAAANRPTATAGLTPADVAKLSGNTIAGSAMRMVGIAPLKPLAARLENLVQGKTFKAFDELLTSKEGAETLAKLAKVSATSEAAHTILATWAGMRAQSGE